MTISTSVMDFLHRRLTAGTGGGRENRFAGDDYPQCPQTAQGVGRPKGRHGSVSKARAAVIAAAIGCLLSLSPVRTTHAYSGYQTYRDDSNDACCAVYTGSEWVSFGGWNGFDTVIYQYYDQGDWVNLWKSAWGGDSTVATSSQDLQSPWAADVWSFHWDPTNNYSDCSF